MARRAGPLGLRGPILALALLWPSAASTPRRGRDTLAALVAVEPGPSLGRGEDFRLVAPGATTAAGEDGMQDYLKSLWGSNNWPPKDADNRPPLGAPPVGAPWDLQISMLFLLALAAFTTYVCRSSASKAWSGGPGAAGSDLGDLARFALHLRALSSAIAWRHTHRRALLLHALRVALPLVCLFMVYKMRRGLASAFNAKEGEALEGLTGSSTEGMVSGVVEYSLTVTMVYVVMMSMVFFVWHVTAEAQSGFRHLLHVSGLSRPAYMLATAGVDGVLLALAALVVMLVVSGFAMQIRTVLWTSPTLLLTVLTLLALSSISTGYLLALLCPSPRLASTLAQLTMLVVVFVAPFSPSSPVVPPSGGQSWKTLLLPTIPAYRALFELVAGCVKGRCLTLEDVTSAVPHCAAPWTLAFGSNVEKDFTPPASLCSFVFLVLVQLKLTWLAIFWLDRRQNPPLHDSGALLGSGAAGTASGAVLEVKGLVHRYGWLQRVTGAPGQNVLSDVSFSVMPGTMLGLLGPNGSGKTTTIRCIIGEERPCEGSVAINVPFRGACVGLCPQETCINGDLTVEENLCFFAFLRDAVGPEAERCVERILAAMRLKDKRDWMPDTLSGGMRRRLAVGCAMIASPAVTILDEPTTGLDPITRRGIWTTIHEIMAVGGCCLLTTHMLEEAEELCHQLVILTTGRKVAEGTVQQLKQQYGTGYLLSVDSNDGEAAKAKEFIEGLLANEDRAAVKVTDKGQMTYRVRQDEEALGHLIINIARRRGESGIKHWGISQASLEDAYVQIIQQDAEDQPVVDPAVVV
mmetsp:Transcript_27961/g.80115  ORF Transcript_27961/g.80115 Transcript_27961/m.80115 type:complete len:803 (-) Transcript_27961:51-2459(-)